jgi:hypothetical protein
LREFEKAFQMWMKQGGLCKGTTGKLFPSLEILHVIDHGLIG